YPSASHDVLGLYRRRNPSGGSQRCSVLRTEASYHGGCRYPLTSRNGDMATRNLFVWILSPVAFRESKRRDPRVPPVWIRRLRVIFVRIPERAVVRRIYCHLTVIAECNKVANLRTMSFDNRDLFARQLAQRVSGPSARIMN